MLLWFDSFVLDFWMALMTMPKDLENLSDFLSAAADMKIIYRNQCH